MNIVFFQKKKITVPKVRFNIYLVYLHKSFFFPPSIHIIMLKNSIDIRSSVRYTTLIVNIYNYLWYIVNDDTDITCDSYGGTRNSL